MADLGDDIDLGGAGDPPGPAGPEQWLGADPVQSFGSTIENALQQLAIEVAGLRAERDGLRLELEGIRTQLTVAQQQLADRDRFAATVRELGDLAQRLAAPTPWHGAVAPAAAPTPPPEAPAWPPAPAADPTPQPTTWAPTEQPAASAVPPAPAPEPALWAMPEEPPAWAPPPPAPTAAPDPAAWAPAANPDAWAVPAAPTPAAPRWVSPDEPQGWSAPEPWSTPDDPQPWAATTWSTPDATQAWTPPPAPPAPPAVEAPEEPAAPAPSPSFAMGPAQSPTFAGSFGEATKDAEAPQADSDADSDGARAPWVDRGIALPSLASAEQFFDQPGVWVDEPKTSARRRIDVRTWAGRIGTAIGGVVVVVVLLVSVGPKFLPYQTFFVRSGSMEPAIETGELIVLTQVDASELDVGDVITFDRPDRPGTLVTHRIVGTEEGDAGRVFVTKGDANGSPDAWRVPAVGTGWRYAFGLPKVGYVFGHLSSPPVRLALLIVPAVLLGLLSLIDIWRPKTKHARGR